MSKTVLLNQDENLAAVVIVSVVLWTSVFFASHRISLFLFPSYRKLESKDAVEWCSRITSNVHAVFGVFAAVHVLQVLHDFDFLESSVIAERYFGVLLGYLSYDLATIFLYHGNLLDWGILFHHFMGLLGFSFLVAHHCGAYPGSLFYFTEISTPFVNQRWFLEKSNAKQGRLYLWNGILMWCTFSVRIFAAPVVLRLFYNHFDQIVSVFGQWFAVIIVILASLFNCLNAYWFWLISKGLAKAIVRTFQSRVDESRAKST